MTHLNLVSLIVHDYDDAIAFFTGVLDFELVEDAPSVSSTGKPKRWVVVRPTGAETGLLLARADGERQEAAVGDQFAGRVGLFLRVDDFDSVYQKLVDANIEFVREPSIEEFGKVAVFKDLYGNKWDLVSK